jgi:hypothetical protein
MQSNKGKEVPAPMLPRSILKQLTTTPANDSYYASPSWLRSTPVSDVVRTYEQYLKVLVNHYSTEGQELLAIGTTTTPRNKIDGRDVSLTFEQLCRLCVDFQLFDYCNSGDGGGGVDGGTSNTNAGLGQSVQGSSSSSSNLTSFNSTLLNHLRNLYLAEAMRTIQTPLGSNNGDEHGGGGVKTRAKGQVPPTPYINQYIEREGRKPRLYSWITLGRIFARMAVDKHVPKEQRTINNKYSNNKKADEVERMFRTVLHMNER